jgi:MoaA/NifB/PqqE/SkfB family radical SAM enzyme
MSNLALPFVMPKIKDQALETAKYANLLRALRSRRAGRIELDHLPVDVSIDMSTACHLKCVYCATGSGVLDRKPQVLGVDEHQRILDFCGEQLFNAWYFSNGEPLLNKRMHRIIADAARRDIFTVISTSLSVPLSDQRVDEILLSGLGILSCAIDGIDAATYNKYRVGGNFALVMKNLDRLVARKRALDLEFPLIEWRCLVFRHNQDQQEETARFALDRGVDMVELWPGVTPTEAPEGGVASMTNSLKSPPYFGPAIERGVQRQDSILRRLAKHEGFQMGLPGPEQFRKKCDWLYFSSMFYPGDSVGPCCVLGNIDTDFGALAEGVGYRDIWNNNKYREARECFQDSGKSSSVCRSCPNPMAQDYFFRSSLKAYLLNAPEWFLNTVCAAPDQLFYPVDLYLMPEEFLALKRYRQAKSALSAAAESAMA